MLNILILFFALNSFALEQIDERISFIAPVASTIGTNSLWQNPAGLGFMGGTETTLGYLYESSKLGARHHVSGNLGLNFGILTFGFGGYTKASLSQESKNNLGTELSGILASAIKLGQLSVGLSAYKSHNFLSNKTSSTLLSLGFQARAWPFLSFGGLYQQIGPNFFSAPNITCGIALRPFKEFLTIGLDTRFKALSEKWEFLTEPIFSLKTEVSGFSLALGAEIPGIKDGWHRPIFSIGFEANLANAGLGFSSLINHSAKNYGFGTSIRASSEEWPAFAHPQGLYVRLVIDPDGNLERKKPNFIDQFFQSKENPLAVLAMLRRMEKDQSIRGVLIELNGFSFGNARTEEWREAILALRKAEKDVIIYLDAPNERDYYVASAANKILMNRQESLSMTNFRVTLLYFADMLEKFGVKAEAIAAGSYKTAPRQWTSAHPQKEEIEVTNNILQNFYNTMLKDVSEARNIPVEKLKAIFNEGEVIAQDALSAGLVDELINPGHAQNSIHPEIFLLEDYDKRKQKQVSWQKPKKIAVIPINDSLENGRKRQSLSKATGASDVLDELEEALDDDDVVGIIMRIDSPGGDAQAGQAIQKALLSAQKEKPIIASMSDVAASAGYLIASGTNRIFAMPNTITGSIGIFSLMFSGEKLSEKLGINKKELSAIKNPGPSIYRPMNASEKKQAQKLVDYYYQNFIQSVSTGINMSKQDVLKRADGRVWLGFEALEKKLIHEIGGFMEAVDLIKEIAEVPKEDEVIIEIRDKTAMKFALSAMDLLNIESSLKPLLPILSPYTKAIEAFQLSNGPKARLPFDINRPNKNGYGQ